jgi:hypothetical protein
MIVSAEPDNATSVLIRETKLTQRECYSRLGLLRETGADNKPHLNGLLFTTFFFV